MSDWQAIRLLRARPPAGVNTSERAGVFASALEQSEQLMRAAERIGPAARPLLLFYSLSQAGRAIAAARIEDDQWRLSGHGLSVHDSAAAPDVLRRIIAPQARSKRAVNENRRTSFAGVAEAVGSNALTGEVNLGAVWCAIPELIPQTPQMPDLDAGWRRPLIVFDTYWNADPGMQANRLMFGTDIIVCGLPSGANAEQITAELGHYPAATGAGVRVDPHLGARGTHHEVVTEMTPEGRDCPRVAWRGQRETHPPLDQVAPDYRGTGIRLLMPRLPTGDLLTPLMLWWMLLLGLSSVARYDPELWISALDVNCSEQAVPIEAALDAALVALPDLILDALVGL